MKNLRGFECPLSFIYSMVQDTYVRNFVLQITYQSHDICPIKFFKIIMQISLYFENYNTFVCDISNSGSKSSLCKNKTLILNSELMLQIEQHILTYIMHLRKLIKLICS